MKNFTILTENSTREEPTIVRPGAVKEIPRGVLRKKLRKQRHLVIEKCIESDYLDSLFPEILRLFDPQTVTVSTLMSLYMNIVRRFKSEGSFTPYQNTFD